MEDEIQNKRQINCHAIVSDLERKRSVSLLLQTTALKKWRQRNVWQMAELKSSGYIAFLWSSQPSISYSLH